MRSLFSLFAKPSRRRSVRRREVFSAQFDGGQSAALYGTSLHLGCDVLERRIVLTASPDADFVFSQGAITGYAGKGSVVEIPSTIGGVFVTSIGSNAFQNAPSLTSLQIPGTVTSIGEAAFQGCTALASATIGTTNLYGNQSYSFSYLKTIGDKAFAQCASLKSVVFKGDPRITSIGNSAFSGCSGLTSFAIPDSVTSIGTSAFAAAALTAVTIPRSVTTIGDNAFTDNTSLKSVTIANAKTSIGNAAFYGDSMLATVSLGNGVTSIGSLTFASTALTAVTIPRSVTTISDNAFALNASLTRVTIANAKTSIGNAAFFGASALAKVSLGNGVTSIGDYAFCRAALTAVKIPNSVTTIGDYAFADNDVLKRVTMGNHVISIGANAFAHDTALESVTFTANAPTVGVDAFRGVSFGATAIRVAALTGYGQDHDFWNGLIVLTPAAVPAPTVAPTVTVSAVTLAQNATTMTIKGKGFWAGVPEGHTVAFNNGAEGTVTAATATRLTVTLSTQPTSTGPLTAVVTSAGGQSVERQVATVVAAPAVTLSTANLANSATIMIYGTGFNATTPSANKVVFNLGVTGRVTAATSTSLTVKFGTKPTATGSLTAVVTSYGGSSGTPVQVATVLITYQEVTVGNPNNASDLGGYGFGSVAYSYQIGKYVVTIGQYAAFLNSVAKTDMYLLYNSNMATNVSVAGIQQNGSSGSYTYSVIGSPNRPITYVSWFDAARFANWMTNGQGNGGTETGAYTLVDGQTSGTAPSANPGAKFRIPTENEWYKAAYYSPNYGGAGVPGYYKYATQSNTAPGNKIGDAANQANYRNSSLTDVGAFSKSGSFYGTFDQSGNVDQWNDLDGTAGSSRGLRGGSWSYYYAYNLSSFSSLFDAPSGEDYAVGFRLASPV